MPNVLGGSVSGSLKIYFIYFSGDIQAFEESTFNKTETEESRNTFQCDECHREYNSHKDLHDHKRQHMKWTCPKCNMTMIKRKFKKHMETVHNEKDIKVFQCKCQYQTFSKEALDKHVESCTTINR